MGDLGATQDPVAAPPDPERHARLVRRYATRVTVVLMVLCPALFLAGMWASGVDSEQVWRVSERFSPANDVCLRLGWQKVAGKDDLVQVCSEWIQLSDPSGATHRLSKATKVLEAADGRLYFDDGARADWHLAAYVAFVGAILAFGWFVRRLLVARYRRQLEAGAA